MQLMHGATGDTTDNVLSHVEVGCNTEQEHVRELSTMDTDQEVTALDAMDQALLRGDATFNAARVRCN